MLRQSSALLLFILFSWGCASGSTDTLEIEDFFPMEIGSSGLRRWTTDLSVGGERHENSPQEFHTVFEYTGVVHSARWDCNLVEFLWAYASPGGLSGGSYSRISDGQLQVFSDPEDSLYTISLAEPLVAGGTWTTLESTLNLQIVKEIVSTDEAVTVPAGTVSCIHVRTDYTIDRFTDSSESNGSPYDWDGEEYLTSEQWFAPGMGCVRYVERCENHNQYMPVLTTTWELVETSPGPGD